MNEFLTTEKIDEVVSVIKKEKINQPKVGIILGSGLGGLAAAVEEAKQFPFGILPHWPVSTVQGHQGHLVFGNLENQPVVVMQGRCHYYEGYSMATIGLPVRVMQRLGIEILIVTNAAGAVNPDFNPGELMLIIDHLNLVGIAGLNPLRGPNLDEFGPRFPDMSQPYDKKLCDIARQISRRSNITLNEGVYASVAGPLF